MVNPINPKASSSPIVPIISCRVEPVSFIKNWIIISLEIFSLLFRLIIFPPKIQKRTNGFSVSSIFFIYLKTLDTYIAEFLKKSLENRLCKLRENRYKTPSCHLTVFVAHHSRLKRSLTLHKNLSLGWHRFPWTPHDCRVGRSKNILEDWL